MTSTQFSRHTMPFWIFLGIIGLAVGQNPRLTFHLDSPEPDPDGGAKDLSITPTLFRTINSIFCYGAVGDKFVVRIDPNNARMEIIDRSIRLNKDIKGIDSCMPASNPVSCISTHFCSSGNHCIVNLAIDCGQLYGPAKWERSPQIEALLEDVHGELVLKDCYVMCLDSGYVEEKTDSDSAGLSYTAIGLIVSGVVLVAAMFVAGCVFYKLRVIRRMDHPAHHHMQFAK